MLHSNIQMSFLMLLSGLCTTMNIWAKNFNDIRLSMNDVYMIFLMTSWMFFFMAILQKNINMFFISSFFILVNIIGIRYQIFVNEKQFVKGMIVHHSMALTMADKLEKKGIQSKELEKLVHNIQKTQTEEIKIMKKLEKEI